MLASVIIGTILFIVAVVIYLEYRNEKKYRQERRKREETKHKPRKPEAKVSKRPAVTKAPKAKPERQKAPKPEPETVKTQAPTKTVTPPKTPEIPTEETKPESAAQEVKTVPETPKPTPTPKAEPKKEQLATELPKGEYPDFNYDRLIEMGLSEEEAMEFIQELIPQIGGQIPLIDEAMKIPDFHKMERLTHSIKGSSTTIGTGGVSDLLVDYNTYLKTGKELPVAEAYQEHLKRYFEKLKKQFPPEE